MSLIKKIISWSVEDLILCGFIHSPFVGLHDVRMKCHNCNDMKWHRWYTNKDMNHESLPVCNTCNTHNMLVKVNEPNKELINHG